MTTINPKPDLDDTNECNYSSSNEDILNLLESYKKGIIEGTLTSSEHLLLLEFTAKNHLMKHAQNLPHNDNDMLKYAFLGAYIYSLLRGRLAPP